MNVTSLAALLALSIGAATPARAEPELSGRWKATFATEGIEAREADVLIDGLTGSWVACARPSRDKGDCVGRPKAIVLSDTGTSTVSLRFDASTTPAARKGLKARLTVVDEKTLEGEFDDGRVLRLVRR